MTKTPKAEAHCSLFPLPSLLQDVPLISLANILHNAKLWNDAVIVATMAVEIAPHFAVNHFTLGNVYVAMVRLGYELIPPTPPQHIRDLRTCLSMSRSSLFLEV